MLHTNVAEGVHRIEDCHTNWYVVEEDRRLTVVDAGLPSSWNSFLDALGRIGRSPADVAAVVLTHAHFDHVGFAERARRELGVPVYVHENDAPLTRRPWRYAMERPRALYFATQVRALPIVASFLRHRAFWPAPIKEVVRYENGMLAVPGSPHVVFTPGHTLGHCALHFPDRDALIAGDALVTLDPYTAARGRGWSRGPRPPTVNATCARSTRWHRHRQGPASSAPVSRGPRGSSQRSPRHVRPAPPERPTHRRAADDHEDCCSPSRGRRLRR